MVTFANFSLLYNGAFHNGRKFFKIPVDGNFFAQPMSTPHTRISSSFGWRLFPLIRISFYPAKVPLLLPGEEFRQQVNFFFFKEGTQPLLL